MGSLVELKVVWSTLVNFLINP